MIRFFTILISFQLAFTTCNDKKQENISKKNTPFEKVELEQPKEESGTGYSDSMINELINNSLPKPKLIIDTLETLLNANCEDMIKVQAFSLSESDIEKYDSELTTVSEELKKVLNVTHCYTKIEDNENYKMNVYYNQQYESHYSASFELITINKKTLKISKLLLARRYGSEQGDAIVSSIINENNVIKRKILSKYRYIHGIGKVDSTSVNFEEFSINKQGEIEQEG